MLPNKPRGVPRVNDRRVLNGIFWVLRSGAPWQSILRSKHPPNVHPSWQSRCRRSPARHRCRRRAGPLEQAVLSPPGPNPTPLRALSVGGLPITPLRTPLRCATAASSSDRNATAARRYQGNRQGTWTRHAVKYRGMRGESNWVRRPGRKAPDMVEALLGRRKGGSDGYRTYSFAHAFQSRQCQRAGGGVSGARHRWDTLGFARGLIELASRPLEYGYSRPHHLFRLVAGRKWSNLLILLVCCGVAAIAGYPTNSPSQVFLDKGPASKSS